MENDTKKNTVPEYLITAKTNAINDCRLLYRGLHRKHIKGQPLMPIKFGWENGPGWNREIADLSYRLEALNLLFYPKYGVRIEASQVKEKFGTLRFYYDIVTEVPKAYRLLSDVFMSIRDGIMSKVDFGYKLVVDKEEYTSEEWNEISKEDYDNKSYPEYVSNTFGWKFKEEDGKYYRNSEVLHPRKAHREHTKHKWLYAFSNVCFYISRILDMSFMWNPPTAQSVIGEYLDSEASRLCHEAERRCYNVCEDCGREIGTEYSPRYVTNGWITYICDECAKEKRSERCVIEKRGFEEE